MLNSDSRRRSAVGRMPSATSGRKRAPAQPAADDAHQRCPFPCDALRPRPRGLRAVEAVARLVALRPRFSSSSCGRQRFVSFGLPVGGRLRSPAAISGWRPLRLHLGALRLSRAAASSPELFGFRRRRARERCCTIGPVKSALAPIAMRSPSCSRRCRVRTSSTLALGKFAELERPERDADQPVHLQAEMLQHIAHLAVLALADREGEPDIRALLAVERRLDRAIAHAVDRHALAQARRAAPA